MKRHVCPNCDKGFHKRQGDPTKVVLRGDQVWPKYCPYCKAILVLPCDPLELLDALRNFWSYMPASGWTFHDGG
jgi:hypothetical protein